MSELKPCRECEHWEREQEKEHQGWCFKEQETTWGSWTCERFNRRAKDDE